MSWEFNIPAPLTMIGSIQLVTAQIMSFFAMGEKADNMSGFFCLICPCGCIPLMSCVSICVADDMIETENESLRERVSDLEKKALDQGDEIVCLRSTLADVLRRLTLLENAVNSRGGLSPSSTGTVTPVRNGGFRGKYTNYIF